LASRPFLVRVLHIISVIKALAVLVLGTALAAAEMAAGHAAGTAAGPISAPTPIRHVVVIYQENHSFDNVLGQLCAQHLRPTPCDGATTGQLANGSTIKLSQSPDIVPNVDNSRGAQTTAIDGGKMDRFSRIAGCSGSHYACYSQYWPSQIPNLSNLATAFAISDRTFELNPVPTWGGHVELVAATLDGFTGDNPPPKSSSGIGWGCDSSKDAYWRSSPAKAAILVPACVPKPDKSGPYRSSPVAWVPTIMDRLDAAADSWKLYASRSGASHPPDPSDPT
jgi:phospholipase C